METLKPIIYLELETESWNVNQIWPDQLWLSISCISEGILTSEAWWPRGLRRLVSPESMVPAMVPAWGRLSRRWRSLSTVSTTAPSAARTRWRGRRWASGSVTTRTAASPWLGAPGTTPPPPLPLWGAPSGGSRRWRRPRLLWCSQCVSSLSHLQIFCVTDIILTRIVAISEKQL